MYITLCIVFRVFSNIHANRILQTKGMHGLPRFVVYTSVDAHYSIKKLCAFEGIGTDNLYLVNTDAKGKMDVCHLRQQIQRTLEEKAVPIMVSATAGEFEAVCRYMLDHDTAIFPTLDCERYVKRIL